MPDGDENESEEDEDETWEAGMEDLMEEGDGGVYDEEIRCLGLSLAGVGVGSKEAVGESSGSPAALSPAVSVESSGSAAALDVVVPSGFSTPAEIIREFKALDLADLLGVVASPVAAARVSKVLSPRGVNEFFGAMELSLIHI